MEQAVRPKSSASLQEEQKTIDEMGENTIYEQV
jgi:hypothetical protein